MTSDPQTDAIVEARLASLHVHFPGSFGPEDELQLRKNIERSVKLANAMKKHQLANGDQPFVSLVGIGTRIHE